MDNARLDQQFAFLLEADKEKFVGRQTYLHDGIRKENDAEHSWHLGLMTLILSEYANEEINLLKTLSMVLIHDLVEIYAGDTYAYDTAGKATEDKREREAAEKLYSLLPEDQAEKFRSLWEEFQARETPEAKFAKAMDNVQPTMLNHSTNGISWTEHGVFVDQVYKRNEATKEGSETLWAYAKEHFVDPHVGKQLGQRNE